MPVYSGLFDEMTRILLAISTNPASIVFAGECTPNAWFVHSLNAQKLFRRSFFAPVIQPSHYVEWTVEARKIVRGNPSMITAEIRARSLLAIAKVNAINSVMAGISVTRLNLDKGVRFSETVYAAKNKQAQMFKDSGYDETLIMDIPHVVLYADLAKLSLREAADMILFKAKLDDEYLAKSELLRLTYFDRIRKETEPSKLPEIVERFIVDCYTAQIT